MKRKILYGIAAILFISLFFGFKRNNKSRKATGQEKFKLFFDKFNTDSAFQKSRIIFPFESEVYYYIDVDENDEVIEECGKSKIAEKEWHHINLGIRKHKHDIAEQYTQNFIYNGDTAIVQYRGVENGSNFRYLFIKQEGLWYLYKHIDESM